MTYVLCETSDDDRDPRWIPGAQGFADDIRRHAAAYAQAEPDGPPTAWTPEYVAQRFAAAVKAGGRWHGPQAMAGFWPPTVVEYADRVDKQAREQAAAEAAAEQARREMMDEEQNPEARLMDPTLVEEALRWPMAYLRDQEREAVCLVIWAQARARLLKIEPFLRRARMAHNHHRERAGEALPDEAAFELEKWRARLADGSEFERAQHIAMVNRFASGHVCPIEKTYLHRWRKKAAALISDQLEADGVKVR